MPYVYREKTCPKCGTKHRKQRKHCSAQCALIGRKFSKESIAKRITSLRRTVMARPLEVRYEIAQKSTENLLYSKNEPIYADDSYLDHTQEGGDLWEVVDDGMMDDNFF